MPKATATLGLDGPQYDEKGRRVIEQGPALLMDFAHRSPRSYRGKASGYRGHDGRRVMDPKMAKLTGQRIGTWAPVLGEDGTPMDRRRWTTALRPEALDQLHALAVEAKRNRCEVVEALLLDPVCRERALAALQAGNDAAAQQRYREAVARWRGDRPAGEVVIRPGDVSSEEHLDRWRPILEALAPLLPSINLWEVSTVGTTAYGFDDRLTVRKGKAYAIPYPPAGSPSITIDWAEGAPRLERVLLSRTAQGPFEDGRGGGDGVPEWAPLVRQLRERVEQLLDPTTPTEGEQQQGIAYDRRGRPRATGTGKHGPRRRLTREEGAKVDQILLELHQQGRTDREELERVGATVGQPLESIRTRLRRLVAKQEGRG